MMNDAARNLARCEKELKEFEEKLSRAKTKNEKVHFSMCVAGLRNTIKELKEQL
jgi:hypothetical protein